MDARDRPLDEPRTLTELFTNCYNSTIVITTLRCLQSIKNPICVSDEDRGMTWNLPSLEDIWVVGMARVGLEPTTLGL